MDTAVSVAVLVTMVYLLYGYHKEESKSIELPKSSSNDVQRWKHDGQQPTEDSVVTRKVQWPEVEELRDSLLS